jgi:hypothetical protein
MQVIATKVNGKAESKTPVNKLLVNASKCLEELEMVTKVTKSDRRKENHQTMCYAFQNEATSA